MADISPWGGGGGWLYVQLEESEFTCAAAVKARKAMEVEIEDLHLQIDDIAKAKTAVRTWGVQGQTRRADCGSFYPKQGSFPSPGLSAGRIGLHSSASPHLKAWEGAARWKRKPARAHLPV